MTRCRNPSVDPGVEGVDGVAAQDVRSVLRQQFVPQRFETEAAAGRSSRRSTSTISRRRGPSDTARGTSPIRPADHRLEPSPVRHAVHEQRGQGLRGVERISWPPRARTRRPRVPRPPGDARSPAVARPSRSGRPHLDEAPLGNWPTAVTEVRLGVHCATCCPRPAHQEIAPRCRPRRADASLTNGVSLAGQLCPLDSLRSPRAIGGQARFSAGAAARGERSPPPRRIPRPRPARTPPRRSARATRRASCDLGAEVERPLQRALQVRRPQAGRPVQDVLARALGGLAVGGEGDAVSSEKNTSHASHSPPGCRAMYARATYRLARRASQDRRVLPARTGSPRHLPVCSRRRLRRAVTAPAMAGGSMRAALATICRRRGTLSPSGRPIDRSSQGVWGRLGGPLSNWSSSCFAFSLFTSSPYPDCWMIRLNCVR